MKTICMLGLLTVLVLQFASVKADYVQIRRDDDDIYNSKYGYLYMNPPKKSLQAYGRYVFLSSGTRYVHSPSKNKRAAHAARINAYNYDAYNY